MANATDMLIKVYIYGVPGYIEVGIVLVAKVLELFVVRYLSFPCVS